MRKGLLYKQSQFASDRRERPSPRPEALTMPPVTGGNCAKQSQSGAAGHTNKPNPWASYCAKQSQSANGCPAVEVPHHSSIPPFHRSPSPLGGRLYKQSQLTEASAMRQLVWTPASAGVTRGEGPVVQTKPIRFGWVEKTIPKAFGPFAGPSAPNKANLPVRTVGPAFR